MGWASEGSKYIGVAPISINSQGGIGLNIANPLTIDSSNNLSIPNSLSSSHSSPLNITYSADTTLTSDVYANNVTIDSGVTITTAGYSFLCTGTFTNNGTVSSASTSTSTTATSISTSYGGSGGGGGGNGGDNGGSTTVAGGSGGAVYGDDGGAGSSATAPTLSASLIQTWFNNGIQNYLEGAGGGMGGFSSSGSASGGAGGIGGYGIFIQANSIIAGTLNTSGANGVMNSNSAQGGGGGGGSIILAYGSGGVTAGTYITDGGSGGTASSNNGGVGGNGIVMSYAGTPITINAFSYTASGTTGIINRISSYSYQPFTTSNTTATAIASQSFTPLHSGLVTIKAVVAISNNTIGDGVEVGLYNGSTLLDSEGFTQEGLASNTHEITLYTEQQFTSPFSIQTYSIQINAVTGGIATAEIQQFEINEVF